MRAGWKIVKLNDVCDIVKGRKPNLRATPNKGDLPYLVARYIRGLEDPEYGSATEKGVVTLTEADTVIICDGSNSGEIFTGLNGIMSSTMGKVVKKTEIYDPYLRHFLSSTFELFNGTKTGSAIPHLDKDAFRKLEIPLPPLAEQKRIVALLDEAFAGIDEAKAKTEANLASARKLTENYFQSIIAQQGQDWAQKQLLELCDIKHGYAFEGEFFSPTGDYVLLTPGNFYERGGYRDRGEKQKYYTGEIPRDYVLSKGDLLVAMTEQAAGLLGSPIIVPESDKFLHNQRLGLVTKKPGAAWTNRFFFHIFNSLPVRKSIHDSATGVKVRHTSPKKIGDVVVMVPSSTSEQDKIVETMESLDEHMKSLSSLYQRKQIRLVQLKQSLLTQAFAGELTA